MWNKMNITKSPVKKASERMTKMQLVIVSIVVCISSGLAQDTLQVSTYQFGIYNQYDLRNTSQNAIATHRLIYDLQRSKLTPKMSGKLGAVTTEVLSFATTYLSMLWSHEFGHSLRAQQVGGEFRIHNVAFPIPYTTMHLPDSISLVDEALSVTAGFEVNHLNVRSIQREFILNNGASNEDLNFAFANRIMYPLYASVIVPIDPEDPEVWINTAGDPVHTTLPVFKNYSDNKVILEDGSVNPDLVAYYSQAAMLSSLFSLLDPQFYQVLGASFGQKGKARKPTYIIGDHENGWTYGTLFNVSPLGYELYMNNYIHLDGHKFSLYFKHGRPFKNNGVGLVWNEFISNNKLVVSASVEAWDQDLFGQGVSGETDVRYMVSQDLGLVINAGYKTEGYVLGKQVPAGINFGLGLVYFNRE